MISGFFLKKCGFMRNMFGFGLSSRNYSKMVGAQIVEPKEPLFINEDLEIPVRENENEVIVKVTSAGVCHSDIHFWEGGYDLDEGEFLSVQDRGVEYPVIPGHEIVGEIYDISETHSNGLEVGTEVLVYPWLGCVSCKTCDDGKENLCENPQSLGIFQNGGYAEYVKVPHYQYCVDIEGLDPDSASSLACSGLTAYTAVRKGLENRPEKLVIIGAGGLGLSACQIASSIVDYEPFELISIDIDDEKLEVASLVGAHKVLNSSKIDVVEELGVTINSCIDFVNSPATSSIGLSVLRKNGNLVLVGLFGGAITLPLVTIPLKNLTIQGAYTGNLEDMKEMIELSKMGVINPIVSAKYKLSDADKALQDLRDGKILGRGVLNPHHK